MKMTQNEIVYTPESQLKHPLLFVCEMVEGLGNSRELAWRLFVRNISAQYRQSILGYFWAFIPPLVTTAIWVFLSSQQIVTTPISSVPYSAFVMTGTILWQTFLDALNAPIRMITSSKPMLVKINFPREALILAGIAEVLFNLMIRLILLVAMFFWIQIDLSMSLFLAPLGMVSLIALGTMIGIFIAPVGALYGDIERALAVFTSFLFFFTPIVYAPPTHGLGGLAMKINPVSPLLVTTRDWILKLPPQHLEYSLLVIAASIPLLVIGWIFYRVAMPHLISRMGG